MKIKELIEKGMDELSEKEDYMNECSENARKIILERISEADFVRVINEVIASVGIGATIENESIGLLLAQSEGSLAPYSHTLLLVVIGILFDNDII